MTIDELIASLRVLRKKYGDLPVFVRDAGADREVAVEGILCCDAQEALEYHRAYPVRIVLGAEGR